MPFSSSTEAFPKTYNYLDHQISDELIDPDALHVVARLRAAGYLAYIVGGSVRDLLLGTTPKDYDISTSAKPEEVKKLFGRNCLLIGRRFRLAHVRFGHKVIEVSTFRSGENESDLIIADNKWGTPEEDVLRRDFTINGLFLDPQQKLIIDYVGGWEDIHKRILRTIGNPNVRFRQDPVRMLRLLKFQARLGFNVDDLAMQALSKCRDEIMKSAPARILEEILRMLESGASASFFKLMTEAGLLEHLFPCLTHFLEGQHGHEVYRYLEEADAHNKRDPKHTLDRAVLSACLIFPILEKEIETQYLSKNEMPHIGDVMMLTGALIDAVVITSFSHFPRRMSATTAFILSTQYRLTPLTGKRHVRSKLMQNKEFMYAMQFLRLRAQLNPEHEEAYRQWRNAYYQLEKHGDHKHNPGPSQHKRPHNQLGNDGNIQPQ